MTIEQKFMFDLKGWVLLPSVLTAAEIAPIAAHMQTLRENPTALPEHERNTYAGPCQELLDHPAVVPILREIIADDVSDAAYGFRCDSTFSALREPGWTPADGPHNGGPLMGPTHNYQFIQGRIFSPAVRVVWELTPVEMGRGGTLFLSGSHKSNYDIPWRDLSIDNPLFETYECPAGSVAIFSENVCHASAPWLATDHPRITIFNHYMHHGMRFHREPPPAAAIASMPPKRRSLFRDVWVLHFPGAVPNDYYNDENRARGMGELG
jgi:hypothetical protein